MSKLEEKREEYEKEVRFDEWDRIVGDFFYEVDVDLLPVGPLGKDSNNPWGKRMGESVKMLIEENTKINKMLDEAIVALSEISRIRRAGLEMSSTDEEWLEYWIHLSNEYRDIARKTLEKIGAK
jgi:hypothetical protein